MAESGAIRQIRVEIECSLPFALFAEGEYQTRLRAGNASISLKGVTAAWEMAHRIDEILSGDNYEELSQLKAQVDEINMFPVAEKAQLEVPLPFIKLRPLRALWSLVTGR